MGERKHDLVATLINQPNISSYEELALNGVLPSNTEVKDLDYYLNIDKVRNNPQFATNGEFDQSKFAAFHNSVLQVFNEYANKDYVQNALEAIESSPRDWTKLDAQRYDPYAVVKITNMPNKITMGMSTDPVARFSDAEMAQANYMRDENGNILDWKPNDKAGLWNGIFRNPAALAIYEEDGVHTENGITVPHKKGELMRDDNGNPFYQELGSKSAAGRELLRYTDLLTVEGQWLNKYDFLDSDDLRKSTAGIVAKTAFQIAPYFIPYVGTALKYATAAKELATAMPSFLKAIDNIFDSDNQEDDEFDKKMNRFANSMQTLKMGTSEAGRGFWTFENLMNQVATSVGQLYQQRALADIAKILPKEIASSTGRSLSTAYMALTSSQYAYDEFKKAGATDQVAGWGALASFASMYGLMSTNYFRQWTTKGTWLEERDAIQNTLREAVGEAQEEMSKRAAGEVLKGAKELTRFQAGKLYQKVLYPIKNGLGKWASNLGVSKQAMSTVSQFSNRSLNEALEELAEEITFDSVKGIFSAIESISGKKLSEDTYKSLNFNWTLEDAIARYTASFVGGAIGGAVFEGLNQYDLYRSPGTLKFLDLDTRQRMMWLIANKHEKELLEELESLRKRGKLGNANLSFIKKIVSEDLEAKAKNVGRVLYESGTKTDNQNELIYQELKATIMGLKQFLNSNQLLRSDPQIIMDVLRIRGEAIKAGAKTDEDIAEYFSKNALNPKIESLVRNGFFAFVTDEVGNTIARLNDLHSTIEQKKQEVIKAVVPNTAMSIELNEDAIKEAIKNNEEIKTLQKEYDELKAELDDVLTGKQADYFIEKGLFLMDPVFKEYFLDKNAQFRQSVDQFYRFKHGKEFSEIENESEKQKAIEEYQTFIAKSEQDQLKEAFKLFRAVNERFAPDLTKLDSDLDSVDFDPTFGSIINAQATQRIDDIQKRLGELEEILNDESTPEEEYQKADVEAKALLTEFEWINKKILDPALTKKGQQIIKSVIDYDLIYSNDVDEQRQLSVERQSELNMEIAAAEANGDIDLANQKKIELTQEIERFNTLIKTVDLLLNVLRQYISDSKNTFRTSSKIFDELVQTILDRLVKNNNGIFSNIASKYRSETYKELPHKKPFVARGMFDSFIENLIKSPSDFKRIYEEFISNISEKILRSKNPDSNSPEIESIRNESYNEAKQHVDAYLHIDPEFGTLIDLLIEDAYSEKPRNPVIDILQKLNIAIDGKPARLLEVVDEEVAKYYSDPDNYQFANPEYINDIDNAIKLINVITAVFDAASNGYNTEVNQYRKALGHTLFAELSDKSAQILQQELHQMINKLLALKRIHELHKASSDRFQMEVMVNMSGKLLKAIINTDISEKVKTIEVDSKKLDIDLKAIWESVIGSSGITPDNITEQNYVEFSLLEQKFRQEVSKKFIEFSKNLSNDSKQVLGTKLAECFGEGIVTEDSGIMTDDKEYIPTPMQSLLYLMTVVGCDQDDYDGMWKAVVEGPEYTEFTPYYSQYLGIKIAWIRANNNHLFNGILSYCKSVNAKSDDDYIKSRFEANNLVCILGGPGTGKSSAMGRAIKIMTKMVGGELLMAAKEDEQRKNLKENVDKDGTIPVLSAKDILDKIGYDEKQVKIEETKKETWLNYTSPNDIKDPGFQSDSRIKILMLDEISLFTAPEIQALCASARQHGYTIIGLGDDKQNKAVFIGLNKDGKKTHVSSSIEDGITITTPSLTVSMRAENNAHYLNCNALDAILIGLTTAYKQDRSKSESDVADELKRVGILSDNITLFCHDEKEKEEGDGFFGDRFIQVSDPVEEAKKWISRFKATGDSLLIIDENTERWNGFADGDKIKVRNPLEVQSAEADYAVVIKSTKDSDLFTSYRDLNTMMTRSRKGTIIISSDPKFGGQIDIRYKDIKTGGIKMNGEDESRKKLKEKFKQLAIGFLKDVKVYESTTSASTPSATPPPAGQPQPNPQSQNNGVSVNPLGSSQFTQTEIPKTEVSVRSVDDTYENHDESKGKLKDHKKWKERKYYLSTNTDKMDLKDFADWLDSDNFKEWITTNEHSPFVNLKLTQDEISDLSDFVYGISMAVITKERNENVENYLKRIAERFRDNKDSIYEILNKTIDYVIETPSYNYIISGKTVYCEINKNEGGSVFNIVLPITISKDELENGKYDDIDFEQKTQPIALTTSGEEFNEVEKVPMNRMHVVGYGIFAPTELSKMNQWTRVGNTIAAISHIPWLSPDRTFMSFQGQSENDITRIGTQKRSTLYLVQKLIQAKAFLRGEGNAPFTESGEIKDVEKACKKLLKEELSWDNTLIEKLKETGNTKNWTSHDWVDFFTKFAIISEESTTKLISALMAYVNTPQGRNLKDILETNMSNWTHSSENGIILEFKSTNGINASQQIFLEFIGNEIINGKTEHKYKVYSVSGLTRGRQITPIKNGSDQVTVSYSGKIIGFDVDSLKIILSDENILNTISGSLIYDQVKNGTVNFEEALNNGIINLTFGNRHSSNNFDYVYGLSEYDLVSLLKDISLTDDFDNFVRSGRFKNGLYLDIKGSEYYSLNNNNSNEFKKPNSTERMECDIKYFLPPVYRISITGSKLDNNVEEYFDLSTIHTEPTKPQSLKYTSYEQEGDVITFANGIVNNEWIQEYLESPFTTSGQITITSIDLDSRIVVINDTSYKLNNKWQPDVLQTSKRISFTQEINRSGKTYTISKGEIYSGNEQMLIVEVKGNLVKFYDPKTQVTHSANVDQKLIKFFKQYQIEDLQGYSFWFVYPGNDMEDMFIAYRGNMASDSIILVSNGNIMIGQYNDGQILVNGIPYSVPADTSNYYSAYGIKLERNSSDIRIYEDTSSITDGSIFLTKEGCKSLTYNENEAIGGYITHIDVNNRTFTIKNKVFQWKNNVTLEDFGLSEANRVYGNKAKKTEFINSLKSQWDNFPSPNPFKLNDIISEVSDYSGNDINSFLKSIVTRINEVFQNAYQFGAQYNVSVSDSGKFEITSITKPQHSAGYAVWAEYKSGDINFDREIDESCVEAKFVVSLPNGSKEEGFVIKQNGKWTVKRSIEKTRTSEDILNELSMYITDATLFNLIKSTLTTSWDELNRLAKTNGWYKDPKIARLIAELKNYC